ncbi:hypothetical protein [Caulobacter vibrioides]|uniref:Uncharacterized protein n=2 Tax=Caulobacter vibrioides TaxID=155892 RepID=Q9A663_CAUVC|nr:hypothetical protein [Caulobacter vibrioides]YP_002517687.1 hypothetical protein CCNA_02314 [Caulobacter vibrioides NA1000]AAK24202.1 hypothetical protein CC_2231 [Caulobacter vibrioides CB15]ACL95779.1 hypothetical protein CCNA_02314 [Caulobacter vibrioides NA1000]ATC29095.1 hypothetical protein CA607_12140 [Caulobacter vibrioides]QXZ50609.1 hypothetical protein KZH45_11900 [Caulobacter vibrioides]
MNLVSKSPKPRRNRLLQALVGAVVAAPLGYFFGEYLASLQDAGGGALPELVWSDVLALLLAAMMASTGLVTLLMSLSRRALGRQINPEEVRPATPAQAVFYAQNGFVLFLAGVMMATPVMVPLVFAPLSPMIASAAMAGLIALLLIQTAGNIAIWVRSDEFMRRAMGESAAISFAILQGLLFLWAAGEKLGLLPQLTLWDAASIMMAVYLVIGLAITWRRGLAS